mmetsp:Transcript_11203/g.28138  ORF Transcript_11203/g.28138 Transcript_11203/m.28138 type:complete len:101 (+) Transcript_11203:365-667(+)
MGRCLRMSALTFAVIGKPGIIKIGRARIWSQWCRDCGGAYITISEWKLAFVCLLATSTFPRDVPRGGQESRAMTVQCSAHLLICIEDFLGRRADRTPIDA